MNSRDNKSSGELKREVLQELNKVNSDLNSLQGRLTPGQFIDDALFTSVGHSPRVVYDHLVANPIGTALLSLGTLLLMENDLHVTYESQLRNRSREQVDALRVRVSGVNEKIHGLVDRTKEKIERSSDKISGIKETLFKKDEFTTTGEYDHLKETVSAKVESVKHLHPLTFAAIGVGLGALTGIALPVSEKEQTLIDQKLGNQMSLFSREFLDAINQSVNVLKDEFLERFSELDVSIFEKKNAASGRNENCCTDSRL
jgi:hypothetical protein